MKPCAHYYCKSPRNFASRVGHAPNCLLQKITHHFFITNVRGAAVQSAQIEINTSTFVRSRAEVFSAPVSNPSYDERLVEKRMVQYQETRDLPTRLEARDRFG
jgi:hypothetical protein